ncbi:MAG: hypothetical protein ABIP36_06010 [Acidimicrobiales bacterium]
MRACPSCRRAWPDERETCPRCLASLVEDLDATIACPKCGLVSPVRMQSCPGCLALLRPDDVDRGPDIARSLALGLRMHRPANEMAFADGPGCTLLRLMPRAGLVLCGMAGLIEANLSGPGIQARPPLACNADGRTLFRIEPYAVERAVVAIGPDGAPLGTYLRHGGPLDQRIDVRDETSAPAARLEPVPHGSGFGLVETGGDVIGLVTRTDVDDELWVDDQWSGTPTTVDLPLQPLAFVAMVVAAKVLLGRPEPVQVRQPRDEADDQLDDLLGPIGRRIIDGFSR